MVKITTKQQFEKLIEKMEAHPNLARGVRVFGETKATTDAVWKGIGEYLNSYGPPTRTPDEWQRVWIHFKAKLKKKIVQNKTDRWHEVSLSPLEQAASDLLQFDLMPVNPVVETDTSEDMEHLIEIEPDIETEQQPVGEQINRVNEESHTPRKTIKTEDIKLSLLEEQTATQTELLNTLKKIETDLYERNEIMEQIKDLKRKKYDLLQEMKEMKKKKYEALAEEQQLDQKIKRTKLALLLANDAF